MSSLRDQRGRTTKAIGRIRSPSYPATMPVEPSMAADLPCSAHADEGKVLFGAPGQANLHIEQRRIGGEEIL